MLSKRSLQVPDIGEIRIYRKKRMKSIRLRVNHDGEVILSVPRWIMLNQAISFARSKKDWILSEKLKTSVELRDGAYFGDNIKLSLLPSEKSRPMSRYSNQELKIWLPKGYQHKKGQDFIKRKVNEVLKSEAEKKLIPRLHHLAERNGIKYKSVSVAILKSRWGSCDNKSNIKLNAYLLQIPRELVDYVILHELNHIKHMNHSQDFWKDLRQMCDGVDTHKKMIKTHSPRLKTFVP